MLWAGIILAQRTEIIIVKWDKQAAVFSTTYWDSEEISAGEDKIKITLQFRAAFSATSVSLSCLLDRFYIIDSRQVDNSCWLNDAFSMGVSSW